MKKNICTQRAQSPMRPPDAAKQQPLDVAHADLKKKSTIQRIRIDVCLSMFTCERVGSTDAANNSFVFSFGQALHEWPTTTTTRH